MASGNSSIPVQRKHLKLIEEFTDKTRAETARSLSGEDSKQDLVGTALSALYQASTCSRKCHGGDHVLECLSGRAYNLGCSAYTLIASGFYDEAQNLIRGIGEILNIVTLSAVDKVAFEDWRSSDPKTRWKKYSPAKIRRILEKNSPSFLYVDKHRYSELCEKYTHVGPSTRPNLYDDLGVPVVGGIYQSDGFEKSMGELSRLLGILSLQISKYFNFDDLFQQLRDDGSNL